MISMIGKPHNWEKTIFGDVKGFVSLSKQIKNELLVLRTSDKMKVFVTGQHQHQTKDDENEVFMC